MADARLPRSVYALFLLENTAVSASLLFIPLLAVELGLSYTELGLVGASYGLAGLASYYLFGRLSDRSGRRRAFMVTGFLACSLAFLLQIFMADFTSMLLVRAMAGAALGIYPYPLIAYISGFKEYERRLATGSAFEALGWFVGNLLAGLVAAFSRIFALSGLLFLIGSFISASLPEVRGSPVKVPLLPLSLVRSNFRLYLSFLLRHIGAHSVWIVFPLFLLELGADKLWIGALYGINSLTQFFAMNYMAWAFRRVGKEGMVRMGLALSSVVFLSYAFSTAHYQLIPVQVVLGLAWSLLYLGSLLYLLDRNVEKATSTAMLGSIISLSSVIGPLIGTAVSLALGFRWAMIFAFGLTALSLLTSRRI